MADLSPFNDLRKVTYMLSPRRGGKTQATLVARLAAALEEVLGQYGPVTDEQRNKYVPLVEEARR